MAKRQQNLGLDEKHFIEQPQTDWFCGSWPVVSRRIIRGTTTTLLTQKYVAPLYTTTFSPEWSVIKTPDFDAVHWTFADFPRLIANGLRIANPEKEFAFFDDHNDYFQDGNFNWPNEIQLNRPNIAVMDRGAKLPLTIQRYALSDKKLALH